MALHVCGCILVITTPTSMPHRTGARGHLVVAASDITCDTQELVADYILSG